MTSTLATSATPPDFVEFGAPVPICSDGDCIYNFYLDGNYSELLSSNCMIADVDNLCSDPFG